MCAPLGANYKQAKKETPSQHTVTQPHMRRKLNRRHFVAQCAQCLLYCPLDTVERSPWCSFVSNFASENTFFQWWPPCRCRQRGGHGRRRNDRRSTVSSACDDVGTLNVCMGNHGVVVISCIRLSGDICDNSIVGLLPRRDRVGIAVLERGKPPYATSYCRHMARPPAHSTLLAEQGRGWGGGGGRQHVTLTWLRIAAKVLKHPRRTPQNT